MPRDGKPFDAVDFNFWGITFAKDPNTFYATLGTGGEHYLVEGDVRERSMRVLRDGVECPSLSPDNTQIAYMSRIGDSTAGAYGSWTWRPSRTIQWPSRLRGAATGFSVARSTDGI